MTHGYTSSLMIICHLLHNLKVQDQALNTDGITLTNIQIHQLMDLMDLIQSTHLLADL